MFIKIEDKIINLENLQYFYITESRRYKDKDNYIACYWIKADMKGIEESVEIYKAADILEAKEKLNSIYNEIERKGKKPIFSFLNIWANNIRRCFK